MEQFAPTNWNGAAGMISRHSFPEGAETIHYRFEREGVWRKLFPDDDGEYVIPKPESTDKLMIICR
jgi:hypothetical protein